MHEYMSATLIVSNIRLKNVHAMTCNKNGDSLVRKYAVSFSQKEKKKICCVSLGPHGTSLYLKHFFFVTH